MIATHPMFLYSYDYHLVVIWPELFLETASNYNRKCLQNCRAVSKISHNEYLNTQHLKLRFSVLVLYVYEIKFNKTIIWLGN